MGVRIWLALVLVSCQPAIKPGAVPRSGSEPAPAGGSGPPDVSGQLEDRMVDFRFDGGQLDFEMVRHGMRIEQLARNRYAVPVTIHWTMGAFDNVEPLSPVEGTVVLPAASAPLGAGEPVVIALLSQLDPAARVHRGLYVHARFGDPRARPAPYVYGLPYPHGLTFAVLQGFHGAFSHRGSNEYAVEIGRAHV